MKQKRPICEELYSQKPNGLRDETHKQHAAKPRHQLHYTERLLLRRRIEYRGSSGNQIQCGAKMLSFNSNRVNFPTNQSSETGKHFRFDRLE